MPYWHEVYTQFISFGVDAKYVAWAHVLKDYYWPNGLKAFQRNV